jgi:hypothetical protein
MDPNTVTADELRTMLPKATLDELTRKHVPWLTTVKGMMTMLAHDTWASWQCSFIAFWSEFPQFVHKVNSWEEVPKNVMAYCHEIRDNGKVYIDISENKDPEINARMILLFNEYIPLMFSVDGKIRLEYTEDPEDGPDVKKEKDDSSI